MKVFIPDISICKFCNKLGKCDDTDDNFVPHCLMCEGYEPTASQPKRYDATKNSIKIWQCKDVPDEIMVESVGKAFDPKNNEYVKNGYVVVGKYEAPFVFDRMIFHLFKKGQKNEQRNL